MAKTKSRNPWSKEDIEYLKKNYGKIDYDEISKKLKRTKGIICDKARYLGITNNNSRSKRLQESSKLRKLSQITFLEKKEGYFYAGFIAGEGSFIKIKRGKYKLYTFSFSIGLSELDTNLLISLQQFLGCGKIYHEKKRKEHWMANTIFCVKNNKEIWSRLIPFIEQFSLFNSYKRKQYEKWRDAFKLQYNLIEPHRSHMAEIV